MREVHYIDLPSVNYQDAAIIPKYIILHCIGGTETEALTLLTKPPPIGGGVSAHYFVPQNRLNTVYRLVPDNKVAYHAGVSAWGADNNLNRCSIGIELHCPNYANALDSQLDWFHFAPFDDLQISNTIKLIQTLQWKFAIKPENILAHSDIAPWRISPEGQIILGKTDPGATFPWEQLAKLGIGIWPKQTRLRTRNTDTSCENVQKLLKAYGYNIPISGTFDIVTKHVITAFQLHYMPNNIDGLITEKMLILLENLLEVLRVET